MQNGGYFDAYTISALGLFHSQLRTCGTLSGLAFTIASVSFIDREKFPFVYQITQMLSIGLLLYVIWFVILSEKQFVRMLENSEDDRTKKDALSWRLAAYLLIAFSVLVILVVASDIFDIGITSIAKRT